MSVQVMPISHGRYKASPSKSCRRVLPRPNMPKYPMHARVPVQIISQQIATGTSLDKGNRAIPVAISTGITVTPRLSLAVIKYKIPCCRTCVLATATLVCNLPNERVSNLFRSQLFPVRPRPYQKKSAQRFANMARGTTNSI